MSISADIRLKRASKIYHEGVSFIRLLDFNCVSYMNLAHVIFVFTGHCNGANFDSNEFRYQTRWHFSYDGGMCQFTAQLQNCWHI